MAKWKVGDRVQVVTRDVTDEDRKKSRYFEHMAGVIGEVQSVYSDSEVAIRVERSSMNKITADVHAKATERMKDKFLDGLPQEQRRNLTEEELDFKAQYVLLVQGEYLVKA